MKQKFYIDTHKGVTALFVLLLMAIFNQWQNPTAWVYLALHGTYGVCWVLKSRIFPDRREGAFDIAAAQIGRHPDPGLQPHCA